MLFKRFELSIYRNLTELCTTPAWAVLLVQRSMSNAPSYNVFRNQGKFKHCKLLLELFRLVAMNCGKKLFNPPSCAAWLLQMTMTCGRITSYTSCVAREPLWRTITVRNHNTTQARYGTRTFVVLLPSDEQSGAVEASKFSRSIPHSSKSGSRSCICNFGHSCNVSFCCNVGYSYNVTVMPLRYRCVTNFLSNTAQYCTDVLNVLNATY